MIIVPPPGMSHPLACMLIESPTFAHEWLTEGQGTCEETGDLLADEERSKLYSGIRTHFTDEDVNAYRRGWNDRSKGKPALFRSTRTRGIVAECGSEWDEDMLESWTPDMRQAYLDGYNAAEPLTFGQMCAGDYRPAV